MLRMLRDFFDGLLGVSARPPSPFPIPSIALKIIVAGSRYSGKSSLILNFLAAVGGRSQFVNQEVTVLQTSNARQYSLRLVEVPCPPLPNVEDALLETRELSESMSYEERLKLVEKKHIEAYQKNFNIVCAHADAILFLVEADNQKSFDFMRACYDSLQMAKNFHMPPMLLVSSKEDRLVRTYDEKEHRSVGTYALAQEKILHFIAKEVALKRKDKRRAMPLVDYISISVEDDITHVFTKSLMNKAIQRAINHLEYHRDTYLLNPLVSLKIREMLTTTARLTQALPPENKNGEVANASLTPRSQPSTPRRQPDAELNPEWFATWEQVLPPRLETSAMPAVEEHIARMV